ncbi:MAG: hypothetical protein Q9184_003047 [Pyrenodesmia sp. 2 TL-2023]
MAAFDEIFAALGYTKDGAEARGEPSIPFESLNSAYQTWTFLEKTKEDLADEYLWENGFRMFPSSQIYLSYPTDTTKITDLLIQAFTVFEDGSWYTIPTQPPASFADITGEETFYTNDEVTSLDDHSQTPKPLDSERAKKSPASLSPMSIQPNPGTFLEARASSKKELAAMVKAWIDDHPMHRFGEVGGYSRHVLETQFACEATLMATGERVWIVRLGILDQYLGLLLEMPDGSYMLVRERRVRKKEYSGTIYQPWLGGDLGFSEEVIANHGVIPRKKMALTTYASKRGLDAHVVLKEHDITRYDLDPHLPRPARKKRQPTELIEDEIVSPKREPQPKVRTPTSTQARTTLTGAASDSDSGICTTSFTELIPLKTLWMQRRAAEAQPPAPKRRRQTTKPAKAKAKAKAVIKTEDTPEPSNPFSFPQASSPSTFTLSASATREVIFHHLLRDPSLGAIPHTYPTTALPTRRTLFTHAINAYGIIRGEHKEGEDVIAASVKVKGKERPIVVTRGAGGQRAWEMVGDLVREEGEKMKEEMEGGRVVVEVTCLVGGVAGA